MCVCVNKECQHFGLSQINKQTLLTDVKTASSHVQDRQVELEKKKNLMYSSDGRDFYIIPCQI